MFGEKSHYHGEQYMKTLACCLAFIIRLVAQPLPTQLMQTDPEQLARALREKRPIPTADCKALDLWECHPEDSTRITDITLRWVQLDNDPELEAILTTEATAEWTFMVYIFDKQESWRMVGQFSCGRACDQNSLVRVQQLTSDSPRLLLLFWDRGGSGTVILSTDAFHLRQGRLWPVFEFRNFTESPFVKPSIKKQRVLASEQRLVIHTIEEDSAGGEPRNSCAVWRWEAAKYTFVASPTDLRDFCDIQRGTPIFGKSFPTGIPVHE
jgi:hypothetical protein